MTYKVLVLASTFPLDEKDSQPRFVQLLCERLAERGAEVTVLVPSAVGAKSTESLNGINILRYRYFIKAFETLAYGGGILENLRANKLKWGLMPFFFLGQLIALIALLRQRDWDVIHAHWIVPQGLLAVLACLITGRRVPILVTSHGADLYSLNDKLTNSIKAWVLKKADKVTVVSNAMKSYMCQAYDVDPAKVDVISMGVDLINTFVPSSTEKQNKDELVFVGRLAQKKGLFCLLDAMRELLMEKPSMHLNIVGKGLLREELERRCRDYGIEENVSFIGGVPNEEVPRWLAKSSISIVPSIVADDGDQEGLGLVAVEAMGCGCVVVASDLPALKDVVIDGDTGFLFKAGNASELANKILLLESRELRERVSIRGREYVLKTFDWSAVADRYTSTIKSLLE